MASVWIRSRLTASGLRFIVSYRLGGRAAPEVHAASFRSRAEAERLCVSIRHQIAAGRFARRDLTPNGEERVYFARLGDLIKIGVSADPARRACDLNATLLHTEPGGRHRERELHDAFKLARVSGEWFRFDARISRYLAKQVA